MGTVTIVLLKTTERPAAGQVFLSFVGLKRFEPNRQHKYIPGRKNLNPAYR
jgi:hypothetical protein